MRGLLLTLGAAVCGTLLSSLALAQTQPAPSPAGSVTPAGSEDLTLADVAGAEALLDLSFTPEERALLLEDLRERRADYEALHRLNLGNDPPPALSFRPVPRAGCDSVEQTRAGARAMPAVSRPADISELAFYPLTALSRLVATRQVSATELTVLFLDRLKQHGPVLEAVVTLTEARALAQAARADEEIARGEYRGPLHGIPWGAKDLFAVAGYPTTWGATPYRDQVIDDTATVVERLDEAGAILVAKLSLGALAWGDVWFGGQTKNPWNLAEGSSGSSAGSAAAVAAGLVPFALGTETWGSIVSPATRVGVTGLRPSFGRVSRHGAMSLAWSMDKVGVLCRTISDCAAVFDTIRGCDGRDTSVVDAPFEFAPREDLAGLRIGFLARDFAGQYPGREQDLAALEVLRALGAELVPSTLPERPVRALAFVLQVEAAAAFDTLTRSNRDDLLVRQIRDAWPNVLRAARFVPAVEYLQANRVRELLTRDVRAMFDDLDVYVAPSTAGDNLLVTNLTGHPSVVVPNGFSDPDSPSSLSFVAQHLDEATLLAVAAAYQNATAHHLRHPPRFAPSGKR